MPNSEQRARRRAHLLVRSSQLRAEVSLNVQALRRPLGLADQARDGVDWLSRNPQWPVGALLIVVAVRPRRALRLASTLWWGYGLFRRAQSLLRKF